VIPAPEHDLLMRNLRAVQAPGQGVHAADIAIKDGRLHAGRAERV
jgi:hypothetical protein